MIVLQHRLPQNKRLQKYGDWKLVETPNKFYFITVYLLLFIIILFHVKSSDFRFVTWFMSILKFGLPRLPFEVFRRKIKTELFWTISASFKRNIKSNDFELMLSKQACQRNHVLNYGSENFLSTKWYPTSFAPI